MKELLRDSAFGQVVRFLSGRRLFRYPEEDDPNILTRFIDEKESAYLANHGDTSPPDDESALNGLQGIRTQEQQVSLFPPARLWSLERTQSYNSRASAEKIQVNRVSGAKVDPEKGKDLHLVTWAGDDDPGNVSMA